MDAETSTPMDAIDNISKAEAVKQQSRQLRGNLARDLADTEAPFDKTGYSLLKFHGTYQGYDRDSATERKQRGTGQALAVHGACPHPRRPADRFPVPRSRRDRRPLRRRDIAGHDAPEHPVSRRRQIRAEGDDRRHQPRPADDIGGVRRCRAHRHDRAGADPRRGSRPARSRHAASLGISVAENRRLSRDLARRRKGDAGGDWRGAGRSALRRALSAAQIQDRAGDPRGQHDRRIDQRSRDRRAVRPGPARGVQFPARRRARHDAQQAGHLSADGDAGRVCRARRSARSRRRGRAAAPRLGRPRQPPSRASQIRHRRARRGLGARTSVRGSRQDAGAMPRDAALPRARPSRMARAGRRKVVSRRACPERADRRQRTRPAAQRVAGDREKFRRRPDPDADAGRHPERHFAP